MYHGEAFVIGGDLPYPEGIGGINRRDTLEINVRAGELWGDVVHVIVHALKDPVCGIFFGIAADCMIPVDLLDPLQIDDGGDADKQIDILRYIDGISDQSAVQSLVE